ncbi:DUF4263 domain-containing protein [Maribacter algarum]|uniref:DUF4263 domain-containing protein n=1 Tax=Maribacter algarum (ex Zhang et al. 2020) TaxID=2578118 RepID=A0A5S3QKR8_9FLAO|nr:Shedu anti-phage system protein SduA domain-containing protein [Maribacter algarum]TMM58444.1 DUF4263 domain-containing protein [Maribacter algarum]
MAANRGLRAKASRAEILDNHKIETLYNNTFEGGRFFRVIFQDENTTKIQLAPKTCMQVVFKPSRNNIESIELVKFIGEEEKQKLNFSKFNFQQLKSFLQFIDEIDLETVSERKLKLADNSLDVLDENTKKKISTLLIGNEGAKLIQELLDNNIVTSQDIVNTGYRKAQLEIFRKLLYVPNFIQEFKINEDSLNSKSKDEIAWQDFFNKNQWIFGYCLDYRFQGILQKEFSASDTDASGKEQVNADFLIGDNNFTTFVELKLPETPLFGNSKNRSGCWSISNDLIDGMSQILEQKASGQIKIDSKELYNDKGELITQKSYDSDTILIIGNFKEQIENSDDTPKIKRIKKKTFELFRRDSRNITFLTYDELYNRAEFIVSQND